MNRVIALSRILWLGVIRRKEIYVLFILLSASFVTLISIDVFGLSGMSRYIAETGLAMAWLFGWIFAVMTGARELPQEQTRGTIYSLLAKPVTRIEVIISKWLGAWSITCMALLAFYILIFLMVASRGASLNIIVTMQCYLLHCILSSIIVSLSIALSTRLNSDAASTLSFVITAASFLVVPRVPQFIISENQIKSFFLLFLYHLLPHFEVFDLRHRVVHHFDPIEWKLFIQIVLYGISLTALFLLIAWTAFRKKMFVRGELSQ